MHINVIDNFIQRQLSDSSKLYRLDGLDSLDQLCTYTHSVSFGLVLSNNSSSGIQTWIVIVEGKDADHKTKEKIIIL